MSILVDQSTRLLVQGMGREGRFHAEQAIEYGTRFVGGVHPGRGGGAALGRPLFNTVAQAVADTGANTTLILTKLVALTSTRGTSSSKSQPSTRAERA